jgi:hypothetical protein
METENIIVILLAGGSLLILLVSALAQPISIWLEHHLKKSKYKAETEEIKLKNKITKDITYHQLRKDNKRKNISGSIKIFREIATLEDEFEKEENPENRRRRLELLARIERSFGENLGQETGRKDEENLRLTTKDKEEEKES